MARRSRRLTRSIRELRHLKKFMDYLESNQDGVLEQLQEEFAVACAAAPKGDQYDHLRASLSFLLPRPSMEVASEMDLTTDSQLKIWFGYEEGIQILRRIRSRARRTILDMVRAQKIAVIP